MYPYYLRKWGKGREALIPEGVINWYMALGLALIRERAFIRAWTFIRGNTVYSKTQGKADLCQSFDVYIRKEKIKVRPHPGQINSLKIRIPSSSGYRCNFGSVNDTRKQGYHLEQFLHRLTSSCCLQGIQDGLDSGFHGDGLQILCQWILYPGFQSLTAFRNPWVVFWTPETRISDCTSKDFPSSISAISCLLFLEPID